MKAPKVPRKAGTKVGSPPGAKRVAALAAQQQSAPQQAAPEQIGTEQIRPQQIGPAREGTLSLREAQTLKIDSPPPVDAELQDTLPVASKPRGRAKFWSGRKGQQAGGTGTEIPAGEGQASSEATSEASSEAAAFASPKVSNTLEIRRQARDLADRRRKLRKLGVAGGAAVAVAALGWVVFFSPAFAYQGANCQVSGATTVSGEAVCQALAGLEGTPVPRLSLSQAQDLILKALSPVEKAEVSRDLPRGLQVQITERVPLAAARWQGKLVGVDHAGVALERTGPQLQALPQLDLDLDKLGGTKAKLVREAVSVVGALPENLRAQVASIGGKNTESLTLKLRNGLTVVWGSAEESAKKARLTELLLGQSDISQIDVSNPQRPSTLR